MPIGAFGAFPEGGAGKESAFCSASLKVLFLSQDAELWVSALNAARDIANGKVPGQALE